MLSLLVVSIAAVAVVATSPRRWSLSNPATIRTATIAAGALTAVQHIEVRVVPAARASGQTVSYTLTITNTNTPMTGSSHVRLRGRAEGVYQWTELPFGSNNTAQLRSSALCNAGVCGTRFMLEWARDPTEISTELPVQCSMQAQAQAIGNDPPAGTHVEIVQIP